MLVFAPAAPYDTAKRCSRCLTAVRYTDRQRRQLSHSQPEFRKLPWTRGRRENLFSATCER